MKVIVDTNIMIDYMKRPTKELKDAFKKENVVLCGVVISELLHGAVSEKDLSTLKADLSLFESYNLKDDDWFNFGEFLFELRTNGLTVPYADAIISYIAIRNGFAVWTRDKHFKLIKAVREELIIYNQ